MRELEDSSGQKTKIERDWTKGSITRNLLSLTWPMIITMSISMMGPFIDMVWVGRLGSASVAGVGIASMAVMLANTATLGLAMGMRAMVARFVGASNKEQANHTACQAFVIGIAYSLVMAVIGIFLAEPILRAFGVEADVVSEGVAYMRIQLTGIITMSLQQFSLGTMQASGDTITPMKIAIVSRALHLALCPFLVLGWWIFPQMGVSGAAVTTVVAQGLGGILALWILFSGRTRLQLTLKNFHFDPDIIWRMAKISFPNLLMHIQQHLSALVLVWFVAPYGTLAVAAHSLWQRVDSVVLTLGVGVSSGAGVLGAQNLGANQPERAEKTGWQALGFIQVIVIICSIVILLWAEKIILIFSPEPDLIVITSVFLRISATSYIAWGFNNVFMGFITGIGATLAALLLEIIPTWGILIPLAYFVPKFTDFGVLGIRWSIVIRHVVAGIIFTIYFWLGRWKRTRV